MGGSGWDFGVGLCFEYKRQKCLCFLYLLPSWVGMWERW